VSEATYLLATRNVGKLHELRPLFEQYGVRVIDLQEAGVDELPEEAEVEAFDTFEENARAKAEYFFRRAGLPTLADDSGLIVHALHGEPGVRSKRWSGRTDVWGDALDAANNAKLVVAMQALPSGTSPAAEYVCAATLSDGEATIIQLGRTPGEIVRHPVGMQGFGYDPYFLSSELGQTFGEADVAAKNAISHRGRAFAALLRLVRRPPG
jgi:XTP/dITP diphosphohydrolase